MKKTAVILFTSLICLISGTVVAYYNTSSFGYDDTNMFSVRDETVIIMNKSINYIKVKQNVEKVIEKAGERFITI